MTPPAAVLEGPSTSLLALDSARGVGAPCTAGSARIVRNSTFNLLAQGCYAVIYLAAIFVMARSLGKEGLGEFYKLFAWLLVVQLIVEAGVGTMLTCRISQAPADWRTTAAEAKGLFSLIALGSALVLTAAGGIAAWIDREPALLIPYVATGVACAGLQVQRYCSGVFRAFELFGCENIAKVAQGALFTALVVILALRGQATLANVLIGLAASHVAAASFMLWSLRRRYQRIGCMLSIPLARNWLAHATPLGFGDVVRGVTWQLDTVLLGWMQPATVVGIYSIAYRPLGPLNWLPRAVATATFPAFARLAEKDRRALARAFSDCVRLLWIASLPCAVAICVCAEVVVRTLAGPDYLEAAQPLRILIWIACLSFLSFPLGLLFAALGQQRSYARLVLGVFLLELVLEVALIPVWGYYGACTGSIAGELVFTITGLALCRYLGIGRIDWKSLLGAAVAAAAMATVLWPARTASLPIALAAVFLSGLVYGLLCFLFGALRRHELGQLTRVLVGLFPRKFSPGSGLGDGRRSPVQLERKGNPHGGSQGP